MKGIPPVKTWSLRLRLLVFFSVFLLAAWLTAGVLAWQESRKHIDEFFDTQQLLFAKTLATANFDPLVGKLPKTGDLLHGVGKKERGKEERDALGFAVFTRDGQVLLTDGEKGNQFVFQGWKSGFHTTHIKKSDDPWRIVWVLSPDGRRVVAVGQELEYRFDMAFDMLLEQLLPWLMLLPVLLLGLLWMLSRELAPLRRVAKTLEGRSPQDTGHLDLRGIPSEVAPLVRSLNSLFDRIGGMLVRERAFISDAAHELRTPLTGLRVQAEVVQLAADDAEARGHAVLSLVTGIDRCARLVEQLLTLSRLEALAGPESTGRPASAPGLERVPLDWSALVKGALEEFAPRAREKGLAVDYSAAEPSRPKGYPALLEILLRNLVGNAVKYTPENGRITIELRARSLRIANSGEGVDEKALGRLGERFFRPPGQQEAGSGLGLSIAREIAGRHGMRLDWGNVSGGADACGFQATLSW